MVTVHKSALKFFTQSLVWMRKEFSCNVGPIRHSFVNMQEHPRKETKEKRSNFPLAIILTAYCVLLLPFLRFVPFWDGASYFVCMMNAVRAATFSLPNFQCDGHFSTVYLLMLSVTQYLDFGNVTLVHLLNIFIGCGGIWAVSTIVRFVHRNQHDALSLWLITAVYAFMPLAVSHALQLNLDFPVMSFFAMFLACLLRGYRVGAVLAGIAMIFSKETGAVVYMGTTALFVLHQIARKHGTIREMSRKATQYIYLGIPFVILVVYYTTFKFISNHDLTWYGTSPKDALSTAFDLNMYDEGIRAMLFDIFVLNFNWIPSVFIVVFLLQRLFKLVLKPLPTTDNAGVTMRTHILLFCLLLTAVYIVTRVRPWNNARYILVAYPALVVCFSIALHALIRSKIVRHTILVCLLLLLILSNFRTIDPVSKRVFHTFKFGSHEMLDMSLMIGPRWSRRDQLVYNFEFTKLFELERRIFRDIQPTRSTVILTGAYGVFLMPANVDDTTFEPTLRRDSTIPLLMFDSQGDMTPEKLGKKLKPGDHFYFTEYPIFENTEVFSYLMKQYPLVEKKTYDIGGYTAGLYTFRLPPPAL